MKIIKPVIFVTSIAMMASSLQGCMIAAVVAATKYGNAKKMEAKNGCQKNYNEYLKVTKKPMPLEQYCKE